MLVADVQEVGHHIDGRSSAIFKEQIVMHDSSLPERRGIVRGWLIQADDTLDVEPLEDVRVEVRRKRSQVSFPDVLLLHRPLEREELGAYAVHAAEKGIVHLLVLSHVELVQPSVRQRLQQPRHTIPH
eukprot:2673368-Rhodomonas_salina.2